ncbi:MAG: hypothetical protein M4579_003429 [Chaenotheca gracillima]|nr:MAG: hypothetical protein M4579_003429 [Chaenotheca gracillima]
MGNTPRAPARERPNYNKLHASPLPLKIYPLPTFVPHNPLSLCYLLYVYITQAVYPPTSHAETSHRGFFSAETRSVHITDPVAIRALWESGFFGKGILSRSEPNWLDREKRRQGLTAKETSEEVTRRRRKERKNFKDERARKEREAIKEQLERERIAAPSTKGSVTDGITNLAAEDDGSSDKDTSPEVPKSIVASEPSTCSTSIAKPGFPKLLEEERDPVLEDRAGSLASKTVHFAPTLDSEHVQSQYVVQTDDSQTEKTDSPDLEILNQEHLQLTLEEAFFLVYGLGVLDVVDRKTGYILQTSSLFSLFRQSSHFSTPSPAPLSVDDPFILSYVVYHHFRSLGWVVRPGIKFAVDWLLYKRGPVFSHAEFAVLIVPACKDNTKAYAAEKQGLSKLDKTCKPWWWLHCANRVQSQVRKSLILVYVELPTLTSTELQDCEDIGQILGRYKVREITLKRWIPNRSRD